MKGTLTFLRHGQTDDNARGVFAGKTDAPLNSTGWAQVYQAALLLKDEPFDLLLYGGALRVRQTAEILMKEISFPQAALDGRIAEMDFGIFDGLGAREIEVRYPSHWQQYVDNWTNYTFPGGGNTMAYFLQCGQYVRGLFKDYPDSNILVVAHKGFILCAYASYLHKSPQTIFDIGLDNGQILRI